MDNLQPASNELGSLYRKYLGNDLSPDEYDLFYDLLLHNHYLASILALLSGTWKATKPLPYFMYDDVTLKVHNEENSGMMQVKLRPVNTRRLLPLAAAVVISIVALSIYFYKRPVAKVPSSAAVGTPNKKTSIFGVIKRYLHDQMEVLKVIRGHV